MSIGGAVHFDANNFTLTDEILGPIFAEAPGIPRLSIMAPLLLPLPLNALFLSLLTTQLIRYYNSPFRKRDKWPTKGLMGFLGLTTVGNGICIWVWTFDSFVMHLGKPHALFRSDRAIPLYLFLNLSSGVIHGWYAFKTYELYRRKIWAPAIIVVLSMVMVISTVLGVIALGREPSTIISGTSSLAVQSGRISIWANIAADFSITVLILSKLLRSRTGWNNTDHLLGRIALMIFECQAPPTIITFVNAVYVEVTRRTELAILWALLGGNVYAICFMYSLLSRDYFRQHSGKTQLISQYRDRNSVGIHTRIHVETQVDVVRGDSVPTPMRHSGLRPASLDEDLDESPKLRSRGSQEDAAVTFGVSKQASMVAREEKSSSS